MSDNNYYQNFDNTPAPVIEKPRYEVEEIDILKSPAPDNQGVTEYLRTREQGFDRLQKKFNQEISKMDALLKKCRLR